VAEAGGEGVGEDVGSRPLATSSMARSVTKKNASKDAGQSGDTNALGRVLTIETIKTQLDAAETAAAADQSITRSISLESSARRPPEIPGARLHSPTPAFHYMPVKLSIEGSARPARWP